MAKNITIVVLAVISIFFVVLANIKAKEAEKNHVMAQLNLELAQENEAKAKAQEQKATEAAARALIAQKKSEDLQRELDECK